ncbi:MAG: hypothetical protein OSB65_11130 [Roseibacillus sp.]|nr:hypothetical protein [Roseibacillus sp.]
MGERLAQFVFMPEPGPRIFAAWAARLLFPPVERVGPVIKSSCDTEQDR